MDLDADVWKTRLFSSVSNLSRTSTGSAQALSRTTMGGTYKVHGDKPALLINDPQLLQKQTAHNLSCAIEYVWDRGPAVAPFDGDVALFINDLAKLVSDKLVAPKSYFRTWELDKKIYPRSVSPQTLPALHLEFCKCVAMVLANNNMNQLRNAAWIERTFESELHPLPDGCGRVAKLLGAWILLRGGKYPAHFDDRAAYYAAMESSEKEWEKFYSDHMIA